MKPLTIAVCSDLHVGHNLGLWPYREECNQPQKLLLKYWGQFCDQVKDEKPAILIVNGDVVDGEQRKAGGVEATTALIARQQTAACDLLRGPASDSGQLFFVRGTPYHEGPLGTYSEPIAQALGAHRNGRAFTHETLDLNIKGVRCSFHHEMPGGGGNLNRGAQLIKELIYYHLAFKEHYALIVRSHLHYFAHVESTRSHAVITPAWQLATPFMTRKSPARMRPDIGALFIDLYPGDSDPVRVRKMLFDLPAVKPLVI